MKSQLQDGKLTISPDGRGGTVLVYVRGRVEQWSERGGMIVPGSGLPVCGSDFGDGPKLDLRLKNGGLIGGHVRKVFE